MKTFTFLILYAMVFMACSNKPSYTELNRQNLLLNMQLDSLNNELTKAEVVKTFNFKIFKMKTDSLNAKIDSLEKIILRLKKK